MYVSGCRVVVVTFIHSNGFQVVPLWHQGHPKCIAIHRFEEMPITLVGIAISTGIDMNAF
jgi:hypothetical protein